MCFELGKLAEVYLFVAALALPFLSEKISTFPFSFELILTQFADLVGSKMFPIVDKV